MSNTMIFHIYNWDTIKLSNLSSIKSKNYILRVLYFMILLSNTNFPGIPSRSINFGIFSFVEYITSTLVVGLKSTAFCNIY